MKPIIAITMGDYNGIGPEIILRGLSSQIVQNLCVPLVIGSIDVFEHYAMGIKQRIHFKEIDSIPGKFSTQDIPVFHLRKFQIPVIKSGKISREAGEYAGEAIAFAAELCKRNIVDGMVTAPISKEALHLANYLFPGQTEMLAKICNTDNVCMMLIANKLRIGLATIHLPVRLIAKRLSKELIIDKISIVHSSLSRDFGIRHPKIAVLGLNPHAGENGSIGDEEIDIIKPAIRVAKRNRIHVDGPFPPDGFFGMNSYKNYDAVLAMYHDQGLIPLKMMGFNIGVNYTAGLPIVRTSPDHGTAFDIAGKGIANPSSMIEAIRLAVQIIKNRKRK
ncbi:MAG: 4-hydroxythreonine-4-phosphate dehydrogenase PdxA [Ignavibacteriales bacterium]|nr:4-hydroxythreonine-4-phosphate dehydrogenase PdxA [Ignavibacteriales bacterium]